MTFKKHKSMPLRLDIQFFAEGDGDVQLQSLLTEVKNSSQEFAKSLQTMQDEIKNHGQVTDATKNKVEELEKKYTSFTDEIAKLKKLGASGILLYAGYTVYLLMR